MAKKKVSQVTPYETKKALQKTFSLDKFKKSKFLKDVSSGFKEQSWIPLSEVHRKELSIPGIPEGHITLLRGHSDTGKTTALLETIINAQKKGILPVIIVTEMKWSWEHAIEMGLEVEEEVDKETGEILGYKGFFLYVDREKLGTIEDVAYYINYLLDKQKEGELPHDMLFAWDSIGSVQCQMSVEKKKNNNEWNAGAMSVQFQGNINQRILMSRKKTSPYTNTLVCINKVWVQKPGLPMEQPKMRNKGGNAMYYDASLVITYGKVTNAGVSKIHATRKGKKVEFAKRTRVQVEKNHVTGMQTKGSYLIVTIHGFIENDKEVIDAYKEAHIEEWHDVLGGTADVEVSIEEEPDEDKYVEES